MACVYVIKPVFGFAKVLLVIFFFMSVNGVIAMYNMRREIIDNWDQYKCNPMVTPLAEFYGHSSVDTRKECLEYSYTASSGFVFSPLTSLFTKFSMGFVDLLSMADGIKMVNFDMMSLFTGGYLKLLRFMQNASSTMQYLVYKIQTLMQRMIAVIFVLLNTTQALLVSMEEATKNQDGKKGTQKASDPFKI